MAEAPRMGSPRLGSPGVVRMDCDANRDGPRLDGGENNRTTRSRWTAGASRSLRTSRASRLYRIRHEICGIRMRIQCLHAEVSQ